MMLFCIFFSLSIPPMVLSKEFPPQFRSNSNDSQPTVFVIFDWSSHPKAAKRVHRNF